MRKTIGIAMLLLPLAGLPAETYYKPSVRPPAPERIGRSLAEATERRPGIAASAGKIRQSGYFLGEALEKRLEIFDRLTAYTGDMKADRRADSQLFAEQGAREIDALLEYFGEAFADYAVNSAPEAAVFDAGEFGARGDGVNDDRPAIQAALERAAAEVASTGRRVRVRIPAGTYRLGSLFRHTGEDLRFDPDAKAVRRYGGNWGAHLALVSARNLVIEGDENGGTRLLFGVPGANGFLLMGCENIRLRCLTLDYAVLPFTQGPITEIHADGSFTFRPEAGFPAPDSPGFRSGHRFWGTLRSPAGEVLRRAGIKFIERSDPLPGGAFRLFVRGSSAEEKKRGLELGQSFVFLSRRADGAAVFLHTTRAVGCERVTVNASPGISFSLYRAGSAFLIGCRIAPPEGSSRLQASDGDGIHVRAARIGAYVADCDFTLMADDAFMSCVPSLPVREISAGRRNVKVSETTILPGTECALVDSRDGTVKAILPVGPELGNVTPEGVPVALAEALPGGAGPDHGTQLGEIDRISRKEKIERPDSLRPLNLTGTGTVLCRNRFRNFRGVGMALMVSNAIAEDNVVENTDVGFRIGALLDWREDNPPHNVVIRGNRFCRVGANHIRFADYSQDFEPPVRPLRRLLVSGNTFEDCGHLLVSGASGVVFENNRYTGDNRMIIRNSDHILLKSSFAACSVSVAKDCSAIEREELP